MAWQTPKTDWTSDVGIMSGDLNRIEGNNQYLLDDLNNRTIALLNSNMMAFETVFSGQATANINTVDDGISPARAYIRTRVLSLTIPAGNMLRLRGMTYSIIRETEASVAVLSIRVSDVSFIASPSSFIDNLFMAATANDSAFYMGVEDPPIVLYQNNSGAPKEIYISTLFRAGVFNNTYNFINASANILLESAAQ